MKTNSNKLFLMCLTLLPFFLFGCNSDNNNIDSPESLNIRESRHLELEKQRTVLETFDKFEMKRYYNSLANPYLILLENGLYKLDLSKEKAESIGIPPEVFESINEEINETNKKIVDLKNKGAIIEKPNPKDEKYREKIQKVIHQFNNYRKNYLAPMWDYPKPKVLVGDLSAIGQEKVYSGNVWAPIDIKAVEFRCQASAAITPMFICATNSSGSWQQRGAVGVFGVATIEVPLYVSNDYINLRFETTDSNGGIARYSGVKR